MRNHQAISLIIAISLAAPAWAGEPGAGQADNDHSVYMIRGLHPNESPNTETADSHDDELIPLVIKRKIRPPQPLVIQKERDAAPLPPVIPQELRVKEDTDVPMSAKPIPQQAIVGASGQEGATSITKPNSQLVPVIEEGARHTEAVGVKGAEAEFDPPKPPPAVTPPTKAVPVHVIDPNFLPSEPIYVQAQENDKVTTIKMVPGENHLLEIAVNHLNRLSTPFTAPEIRTVSRADISVSDGTLYIATSTTEPVTLFVTESGDEDLAMAVTLVPRNIVPQEYRLTFGGDQSFRQPTLAKAEGDAGEWEQASPYVETLKSLLRSVAVGELPPGYKLRNRQRNDPLVYCNSGALAVQPAQVIEGHAFVISVARATNISKSPYELDESVCYTPGVAAVAAWPGPFIKPEGAIELYVVHQRQNEEQPPRQRPSLIQATR